ncbi:hypothetical protein [Tenacibaculum aiptasiae]|uniref:hypothetical protein n=1 Tax=Tenacibaculum aiptasiae TaxID=426481 RepID=UPI00232FFF56|nr:hypothetical protein [Tenacibaculum aiptasiae]
MLEITLKDVRNAILAAEDQYHKKRKESTNIKLENGEDIDIIFSEVVDTRWDYGLPNIYILNKKEINNLTRWWAKKHPNKNKVLPRKRKSPRVYAINLQFKTEHREFNMHVPVS